MQLCQCHCSLHHLVGEKPLQRTGNAGELGIAFGIVFFAVQLVQKEQGGGFVLFGLQEVGIAAHESARLKGFDLAHRLRQRSRCSRFVTQCFHLRHASANDVFGVSWCFGVHASTLFKLNASVAPDSRRQPTWVASTLGNINRYD